MYVEHAQPVPSAAGLTLTGQTITAVVFLSQETMSLVGVSIDVPSYASGPAITAQLGLSLVDVSIVCRGVNQTAISTESTLYSRDLYVKGCAVAIAQSGSTGVRGPPSAQWLHVSLYAKGGPANNPFYNTDVVYVRGQRLPGGVVSEAATSLTPPPGDLISKHVWGESTFPDMGVIGVADARKDCGAKGNGHADDTAALQACLSEHRAVFLPPGLYRISATLQLSPGSSLVGMNNAASVLVAASNGEPWRTFRHPGHELGFCIVNIDVIFKHLL